MNKIELFDTKKFHRFLHLLAEMRNNPEKGLVDFKDKHSEDVFQQLREELIELGTYADFTNVLTDTGVVTEHSLFRELIYRVNRKFFPPVYGNREFRAILRDLNESHNFTESVLHQTEDELADLLGKIFPESPTSNRAFRKKLHPPFKILITRLLYQCTSRQIFDRLEKVPEIQDYILDLDKVAYEFLEFESEEALEKLDVYLLKCEEACEVIHNSRVTEGISLEVTFRIIAIKDIINRIRALQVLLLSKEKSTQLRLLARLIKSILHLESEANKINSLFWEYVELVSYEITEHTGRKGEDYIQRDTKGNWKMLKKGLYGGALVGLLAFLKPIISEFNIAPLQEMIGYSLVYSGIFLLIYFVGGVLATKQPAMTASRLANELDEAQPSTRFLWKVSALIRDTFRSQFLAIFGNVVIALPIAALVYYGVEESGVYRLSDYTGKYLIESLHPVFSFSVVYAFITGICLAASGIAAGAFRNWFIFNKIYGRLNEQSIFVTLFGKSVVKKSTDFVDRHLEGLVGNISLGFMLGILSEAGEVLGLPIDIRHITFASAQLGTALVDVGSEYNWVFLSTIVFGVLLIGFVNLSVSFSVTFFIAFKSRKLNFDQGRKLFSICIQRFKRQPSTFFYRAEDSKATEEVALN